MSTSPYLTIQTRTRQQAEAARADRRHHVVADFGSIEYARKEERDTMDRLFSAIETFKTELRAASLQSNTDMSERLNELYEVFDATVHDAGVSKSAWQEVTEAMS